jgi:hypothetical protein
MVSLRWFGKLRKLTIAPIIVSCIHNYAAYAGPMTTNPFGGRFHNHIGTMFNGTEQVSCSTKGIVNYQRKIVFLGKCCKASKSGILKPGLPIVSRKIALVLSSILFSNSATESSLANLTSIPRRLKATLNWL